MPRIHTKRATRKKQIQDLIIKVISEDYTPEQVRKEFEEYYSWRKKGNSSMLVYAVDRFYPEYLPQYLKWAERHKIGATRKRYPKQNKPYFEKKVDKPEDTKAFLGYWFDNYTNADIAEGIKRLQSKKKMV